MSRKRPCQSGCPHASMLPCEGDVDNDSVCPLCKVHCSYQGEDLVLRQGEVTEDSLALAHAGWCGPRRDKLPASVMRRVQAFLQESLCLFLRPESIARVSLCTVRSMRGTYGRYTYAPEARR